MRTNLFINEWRMSQAHMSRGGLTIKQNKHVLRASREGGTTEIFHSRIYHGTYGAILQMVENSRFYWKWKCLKIHLWYQMESTCYDNRSNFEIFPWILEALEYLAEDQSQKGDTRREANNIVDKIQELGFILCWIFGIRLCRIFT